MNVGVPTRAPVCCGRSPHVLVRSLTAFFAFWRMAGVFSLAVFSAFADFGRVNTMSGAMCRITQKLVGPP